MRRYLTVLMLAAVFTLCVAIPVQAQPLVKLTGPVGKTEVSIGMLSQPTADWEQVNGEGAGSAYVRRLRLIASGHLTPKLKFLIDSDTPNLGKQVGGERQHTTLLQDLVLTYTFRNELQVDGGLLMVPVSYNSLQSAGSLLGVGYGPYSFVSSAPTTSKAGRDQGVQARGYLMGNHIEYRLGGFRGLRQIDSEAPVRVAGRIVWYVFEPQTGFFYSGTSHGKKKRLGIGASIDAQDGYSAKAADLFYERHVGERDALTFQSNVIRYDGGEALRQVPEQNTFFVESGYTWGRWHAGLYGQAARQDLAIGLDTTSWQAGGIWWARGHRANMKVGVGRLLREQSAARTQVVAQVQVLVF